MSLAVKTAMARRSEADRGTDGALLELEKRINEIYGQAAKELQETIDDYFEHFAKLDEKMKKLIGTVRNGKIGRAHV